MDSNKALVVFSGGQDSTTCLFWAKKNFKEVHAITFLYGQRHKIEVEMARKIAAKAGVPITVKEVNFIGEISSGCSLIDTAVKMDPVKPEKTMPNTFVPGRNLFFLSIAAVVNGYAHAVEPHRHLQPHQAVGHRVVGAVDAHRGELVHGAFPHLEAAHLAGRRQQGPEVVGQRFSLARGRGA